MPNRELESEREEQRPTGTLIELPVERSPGMVLEPASETLSYQNNCILPRISKQL